MASIFLSNAIIDEIQTEAEIQGLSIEKLLKQALWQQRQAYRRTRLEKELQWYQAQPLEIRARFSRKYVAVSKQKIIDHDTDLKALNQRVRKQYGFQPVLIIPAEGPREIHIYSPRVEHL